MMYGICPELKIESLLAFSLTRQILVVRESVPAQIDLLVKAGVMSSVLGYSWITPSTAVRELFKLFFVLLVLKMNPLSVSNARSFQTCQ